MSLISKIIGVLGGVYNIFTLNGGGFTVRGTTAAIQGNDGTNVEFVLQIGTGGGTLGVHNAGTQKVSIDGPTKCVGLSSDSFLRWSPNSNQWGSSADISAYRLGIGVLGMGAGAASGAGWLQNTAGRAILTTDVTNDSAVLATTGLTRDLKAGRKYSFLAYLYVSTGAILEGIQAGLNGTATITNLLADVEVKSHAATPVFTMGRLTAFGTAIGQTVADVGNAQVEISGTIEVANAGTFRIDFAKNADTGALNTTVKRGSWLLVEDMP